MRTLLISYCTNPNPNLMECTKNNSGIKPLTVVPHALIVSIKHNYNRVAFDTESKANEKK